MLYDARTGRTSMSITTREIKRLVKLNGWVLAPTHVRHHWTTAIISTSAEQEIEATIIDSAPSPPTRRDLEQLFRRLHIPAKVVTCLKQPRNSLECGLHVVLMAILARHDIQSLLGWATTTTEAPIVSLSAWRKVLIRDAQLRQKISIDDLVASIPSMRDRLKTIPKDAGGIGCEGYEKLREYYEPETGGRPIIPAVRVNNPYAFDVLGGIEDVSEARGQGTEAPSQRPQVHQENAETYPHSFIGIVEGKPLAREKSMGKPLLVGAGKLTPVLKKPVENSLPVDTTKLAANSFSIQPLSKALRSSLKSNGGTHPTVVTHDVLEVPLSKEEINSCSLTQDEKLVVEEWFSARRKEVAKETKTPVVNVPADKAYVTLRRIPNELVHCIDALRALAERKVRGEQQRSVQEVFSCHQLGELLNAEVVDLAMAAVSLASTDMWTISTREFSLFAIQDQKISLSPKRRNCSIAVVAHLPNHFVLLLHSRPGGPVRLFDSLCPSRPSTDANKMAGRFMHLLTQWGRDPQRQIKLEQSPLQGANDCGVEAVRNVLRVLRVRNPDAAFSRDALRVAYELAATDIDGANNSITQRIRDAIQDSHKEVGIVAQENSKRSHNPYYPVISQSDTSTEALEGQLIGKSRAEQREIIGERILQMVQCSYPIYAPKITGMLLEIEMEEIMELLRTPKKMTEAIQQAAGVLEEHIKQSSTKNAARNGENRKRQQTVQEENDGMREGACCKRPPLQGKWCAWHHPGILALRHRGRCEAKSRKERRCNEVAMTVGGITRCWYHATAEERERARNLLEKKMDRPTDAVSQPPTESTPRLAISSKKPMGHANVMAIVNNMAEGTKIEIDCQRGPQKRTKYRGTLYPSSSTGRHSILRLSHQFCARCSAWHCTEDNIALPEIETLYFAVRDITNESGDALIVLQDCDEDEHGSDVDIGELYDIDPATRGELEEMQKEIDIDRAALMSLPTAQYHTMRSSAAAKWYIYNSKPPGVHQIVWNRLAEATRRQHIRWLKRIKGLPPDLLDAPLAHAVVEITLRLANEREWAWSTIATSLSTAASALRDLNLYTNNIQGIDIRGDSYFAAAMRHAQHKARITALRPRKSAPLTEEHFRQLLRQVAGSPAWMLLQLAWVFAARIGDIRRLQPQNINIDLSDVNEMGYCKASAMFAEGKGAAFWGPFSIHTCIKVEVAKPIVEYLRALPQKEYAFTKADQRAISMEIPKLNEQYSVRSIRRGSLVFLAKCGTSDASLQLLSGHRRRDTLLRYLGWGHESSDATKAAQERAFLMEQENSQRRSEQENSQDITGAGSTLPQEPGRHPMWMGLHSGFNAPGNKGRRTKPPKLFSHQPPSQIELGIAKLHDDDMSEWPLHVKDVGVVFTHGIAASVEDPLLKAATRMAIDWTESDRNYGINWPHLVPEQVPYSRYTPTQALRMLQGNKILPLRRNERIRCAAKGFPAAQISKRRLRPVFELLNNSVINKAALPPLKYPSRLSRRAELAKKKYLAQFDFAAWYDQIELASDVQDCYVIRLREPVFWEGESHVLFKLTREPMGATHSAHVAQTITWAILEPILRMDVCVATMIDNVFIASDNHEEFIRAVKLFVERCDSFGATLNDRDEFPSDEKEILIHGRKTALGPTVILGEQFEDGKVKKYRQEYQQTD